MELKEITYILKIYEYRSITKAAEALYLTQPALSKFLKNLEQQIGAPLFHRIGNELIPTQLGERYFLYAKQIASLRENWEAECADFVGEEKGKLSIAIPLMRGSCMIPDILPQFYKRYPKIEITLQEESHSVEKFLISSGDIDLVIYNDTSPQSTLIHEELGKEEIVLIMAQNHPLAVFGGYREGCRYPWFDLTIADKENFVLHPVEQTTGKITQQLLELSNMKPHVLLRTRNSDIAIRMAAEGTALAFAPESYVKKIYFEKPPLCFSVGAPKTETTLYAIYKKGRYLPSYVQYFIRLVRESMWRERM